LLSIAMLLGGNIEIQTLFAEFIQWEDDNKFIISLKESIFERVEFIKDFEDNRNNIR
jgi:hypothetical protein